MVNPLRFLATKDTFSCPFSLYKKLLLFLTSVLLNQVQLLLQTQVLTYLPHVHHQQQHQEDDYYDETQLVELHIVNPVLQHVLYYLHIYLHYCQTVFHKLFFTHIIIFFLLLFTYTTHIIITILFMYFQILFSSHFSSHSLIIKII